MESIPLITRWSEEYSFVFDKYFNANFKCVASTFDKTNIPPVVDMERKKTNPIYVKQCNMIVHCALCTVCSLSVFLTLYVCSSIQETALLLIQVQWYIICCYVRYLWIFKYLPPHWYTFRIISVMVLSIVIELIVLLRLRPTTTNKQTFYVSHTPIDILYSATYKQTVLWQWHIFNDSFVY